MLLKVRFLQLSVGRESLLELRGKKDNWETLLPCLKEVMLMNRRKPRDINPDFL